MALALRLALRDLRGGLGSLRLLAACLFLGVAALAGVGSLSDAIVAALVSRGQEILGGDLEVSLAQRQATPEELAALRAVGTVDTVIRMNAMATRLDGAASVFGEVKAVGAAYPLYGTVRLASGKPLQRALRGPSVVVDRAVLDRLGVRLGGAVEIGEATLTIGGVLTEQPDRIGEGFSFGPELLMSRETLAVTGIRQPGSLYRAQYRLRLSRGPSPEAVGEALRARFPDAGWRIRDRNNAAPGTRRFIERLGQFLTLVGLTSLLVAGVGVASGVGAYLAGKVGAIATLKTLGAESGTILKLYLLQVAIVSGVAVTVGAAVGALVPAAVARFAGGVLPVLPAPGLHPLPLAGAIAYGLLAATAFAILPLARARDIAAARLFRARVERLRRPPPWAIAAAGCAGLLIGALAVSQAGEPAFAATFVAAAIGLMLLLGALAALVRLAAARVPHLRRPLTRLAIANLHRPGAMTAQLVVALGLGLTLFATLAVIETNLARQIDQVLPAEAPAYFALDIQSADADRFRRVVEDAAPGSAVRMVPALRGPVTAVGGTPVSELKTIPDGAWVLRGDRGLTYAAEVPPGNRIVAGRWWPAGYSGPQLVSMEADMARLLGLHVGDTITVSVLGRDLPARIANLRDINWDSLGFNFALVYSPGPIAAAPHSFMATIAPPPGRDRALTRAITANFKRTSLIRVKDVIDSVAGLFGQMSAAIRAAASVAIAAGIVVLVGAIAAARRARIYDSVILKVLGATRRQVLAGYLIEYAILAVLVSGIAFALGAIGGWYVVTHVFGLGWLPRWGPEIATVLLGAAATLGLSLAGSWSALRARPARALRSL